jgi:hypothetical protein
MSSRPSLFGNKKASGVKTRSHAAATAGCELDLREEMDNILYGEDGGPKHGSLVLIRNMRRNADGYPTLCKCMEGQITREADPDCSYCFAEGYLWDESWAWGFWMYAGADSGFVKRFQRMPPGEIRVDYKIFFFRYDTPIAYGDKIVEVALDEEGNVRLPYVREAIYKPQTLAKRRADNGRVEYIEAYCREDDAIKTDNPR